MILNRDVTFVVGAGCSMPYQFPAGRALVEHIVGGLSHSAADLFKLLETCDCPASELREFHRRLSLARPRSIDRFIQSNPHFSEIGKKAIVAKLVPCEQPERLSPIPNDREPNRDWLDYFKSDILFAPDLEAVARNRVSFITFNFDRVLEYSLFGWLVNMYGASESEATAIIRRWSVVHVNGQLGGCAWMGDTEAPRHFQPDNGRAVVEATFRALKIIGDDPTADAQDAATELLGRAQIVIFLGFSFDPTNVRWLRRCGLGRAGQSCYGTRFGMTMPEAQAAVDASIHFREPVDRYTPGSWDALEFLRRFDELHEYPGGL